MSSQSKTKLWDYAALKKCMTNKTTPHMVVARNIIKKNTLSLLSTIRNKSKTLRVATKSIRVPALLKLIRNWSDDLYTGLMTYSARESLFLSEHGFEDFLIAYPRIDRRELEAWKKLNENIDQTARMMINSSRHLKIISEFLSTKQISDPLPVCIDVDMSYRPISTLHIGVKRSSIRSLESFKSLLWEVKRTEDIKFSGIMGYEAQIAGIPDNNPYTPFRNYLYRLMKRFCKPKIKNRRRNIASFLESQTDCDFIVNGGGTGSLKFTASDKSVTEVTAGSGFLQPHLFDYYLNYENDPAYCFGLPVTRKPDSETVTCQSGGFIASGPPSADKTPIPFLPPNISPRNKEGYGEVQTPFKIPESKEFNLGDCLYFRPAKAGEIAERFKKYFLIQDNKIIKEIKTYRGYGECFC